MATRYTNKQVCPRCASTAPHLHPAMACEGEVEICTDDFHLRPTNQNGSKYINAVLKKRARLAALNKEGDANG